MANTRVENISILVVDDDPICLAIVSGVLQKLNHHVVAMKNPIDALCTLRMGCQPFDLVLTDVHMPEMSGLDLLKNVNQELKLPVVLMSADTDRGIMRKGLEDGAAFYFVKPISPAQLQRLWMFAVSSSNNYQPPPTNTMSMAMYPHAPNPALSENYGRQSNTTTNNSNISGYHNLDFLKWLANTNNEDYESPENAISERLTLKRANSEIDGKGNVGATRKKQKLIWTTSLHNLFLEAVNKLGIEKAVPKKILEYMCVPGLRRENVASHLQKYRIFLKRIHEAANSMQDGVPNNWNERPFRSSFVLNEITYLTNNLQHQYKQLMGKSSGNGVLNNDTTRFGLRNGQTNNQDTMSRHSFNKTSVVTGASIGNNQHYSIQGIQETLAMRFLKDNPSSKIAQPQLRNVINIEGMNMIHGGLSSNASDGDLQFSATNYVGLRITSNGELMGLLKDMPMGNNQQTHPDNSTNGVINNVANGTTIDVADNNPANYNFAWNTAPSIFEENNMNVYVPSFVDNNAAGQQEEAGFGASQGALNSLDLSEELRQMGIDFLAEDQDVFGGSFFFGSYDMQNNAQGNFNGIDQGNFGNDDHSFDQYYMQEHGHESIDDFLQDLGVDLSDLDGSY